MGDIYIAAHLRRCLRHSVFGHVLQYTPSTSVLDALHLHHAIKSPPLRYSSPLHITFIEVKNELVKMKDVFPMKVITHTVTHQRKKTDIDTHSIMYQAKFAGGHIESKMYPANFAGRHIESKMYPANFAGGRSRLDLLLPSFLPSREEKKKQDRIFCPLRGHAVGRMQYAPTTCRQESMFQIILLAGRDEQKIQEQKNRPLGSRGVLHTPHTDRVRIEKKKQKQKNHPSGSRGVLNTPPKHPRKDEKKKQDRIFCPLRGHAVRRMLLRPTICRQEMLFPINSREERTETKMQEQKNRPLGSRGVLHTPPKHLGRDEQKMQDRIFCPLRGHSVGRMRYTPTNCRQEALFPINSREERTETKIQDRIFCPLRGHSVGRMQYAPTSYRQEMLFPINSREERTETKMQERIFCPLRGHAVGRMQYAPTTCRQETLFPINSREERTEAKMQEQKNRPLGCRAQKNTPLEHLGRDEKKIQDRIFCPLRGHSVGRMRYAPTTCRQETLFPINSLEERTETKMQDQKNRPLGCMAQKNTPPKHLGKEETKMQERIFCPLRGYSVGRMRYAPTNCRQETFFPINSREERTETKIQERRKQSIDRGAEWHTPFMRQGERDAVWREAFLEQRARVAVWRDRRLEERSSHARLQLKTFGENSKPYKSSLVALSEQLRDIFAA